MTARPALVDPQGGPMTGNRGGPMPLANQRLPVPSRWQRQPLSGALRAVEKTAPGPPEAIRFLLAARPRRVEGLVAEPSP